LTNTTSKNTHDHKKTEILYDVEEIVSLGIEFIQNAKEKFDVFVDKNGPSIIMTYKEYKDNYIKAKIRGIKIRFITEITKENIHFCKPIKNFVGEFRHLEGLQGGLTIGESEFLGITIMSKDLTLTRMIHSTEKEVVNQQQYIFNTFWKNAIPYEQRIMEIEDGRETVKTEVVENNQEISEKQEALIKKSNILCYCSPISDIQFGYNNHIDLIKKILENHRNGKHKGIRYITSINNKNDIELVRILLNEGIKISHISDILSFNFALSDRLFASTIKKMERGKMITSLLISNDPLYLNHYNKIFEEIWKNGVNVEDRIKDLEEDNYANMKIIPSSHESFKLTNELFMLAKYEVLIILPSVNGIIHAEESGSFGFLNKMVLKGVKVKILTVLDHKNPDIIDKIRSNYPHIEFRSLQFEFQVLNRITILDRTKTMILEIKDDMQNNFIKALGMAIFIESKSTALSYASIFDSLWNQTEMYEHLKKTHIQLQIHDKMQKEFINIVAHELRTPITPMIGLTAYVRDKIKDKEQRELLDIVINDTRRLHLLTEKILDATLIDGKLFNLNHERFSLNQLILNIVKDFENNLGEKNKKIKFEYDNNFNTDYLLFADKTKIGKVISNLIENSIKFISKEGGGGGEGVISFNIEKKQIVNTKDGNTRYIVIVIIKDNGIGIHSEIVPRLFTKFASKSFKGTGLGLFISKNIIEAHGGKIWGENNQDEDKGATFGFSLPLKE